MSEDSTPTVKLVKMVRDDHFADVDPSEVENFSAGGYVIVEEEEEPVVTDPMKMKKEDLIAFLTEKNVVIPAEVTKVADLQKLIPKPE